MLCYVLCSRQATSFRLAFSCFFKDGFPSHVCLMGKAVGYSVVEDPVEGFTSTVEVNQADGAYQVLVTNTQGPLLSRSGPFSTINTNSGDFLAVIAYRENTP